jgi:uncharacterized membrane protein YeaQ/YmgE (transglycosylase-associated protein family)
MLSNLIWWAVVGLIAGWAAGQLMKGGGYGVVMDIVLGIVGAVIGGWLLGALGITAGGFIGTIVVAIIGAVFLIWITRLSRRHSRGCGDSRLGCPAWAKPASVARALPSTSLRAGLPAKCRELRDPGHLKTQTSHPKFQTPPLGV